MKQKANYHYLLHARNFLAYYPTLSMEATYASETYVEFKLAQGILSQEIGLFVTTAKELQILHLLNSFR